MQFAVKNGLTKFVKTLLRNDVDPNFSGEKLVSKRKKSTFYAVDTKDKVNKFSNKVNCSSTPLHLAAEFGRPDILKLFKYYPEFPCNKKLQTFQTVDSQYSNGGTPSPTSKFNPKFCQKVNFRAFNPESKENVLHVVLRQHLLEKMRWDELKIRYNELKDFCHKHESPNRVSDIPFEDNRKMALEKMACEYKICLEVLLDMDKFENEDGWQRRNNDPESYPRQVESIVNQKDKIGNTPLHYAVLNWNEEFVEMLLALGANASVQNKNGDIPLSRIRKSTLENFMNKECIIVKGFDQRDDKIEEDSDDEESYVKNTQAYNQSFMMKIGMCGKEEDNEIKFNYAFLAPPAIRQHDPNPPLVSNCDEVEKQPSPQPKTRKPDYQSEMDVLYEMGRSEEHRSLLVHPVVDSYLWMKWQLITNYFHRTARLRFLFLYCITWYILTRFGGHHWNSMFVPRNELQIYNSTLNAFCKDIGSDFNEFGWSNEINQKVPTAENFAYFLFIPVVTAQILMMLRDYVSEKYHLTVQTHVVSLWIDLFNLFLSVLLLLFGHKVLVVVLTILLIFYLGIEMLELTTTKRSYFEEISNYIDLIMLALIMTLLYVPRQYIWNDLMFTIFEETPKNETERCGVRRCIAATTIVLVWTRFLMVISKLHSLKSYNLYVILFFNVLRRYLKIMAWYGIYLVAFGLGFYIMLHNDVAGQDNIASSDNNTSKFDQPFLSLIKTSTMFVGEFDFDDIKIRGGDVSVSMAYLFFLAFVFLMVIVLMNVLNGLAVSDTGRMINESLIESQKSIINNIRYLETIYLDLGAIRRFSCFPDSMIIKLFDVAPKKVFLFDSNYVKDMELSFPLKLDVTSEEKQDTYVGRLISGKCNKWPLAQKLIAWLKGGNINFGTEEFLVKAREILVVLRAYKTKERKQYSILKEIFMMKKSGKPKNGRTELTDVIEKIKHFENILRQSFSNKVSEK